MIMSFHPRSGEAERTAERCSENEELLLHPRPTVVRREPRTAHLLAGSSGKSTPQPLKLKPFKIASCSYMVDCMALKRKLPYHNVGVYVFTLELLGPLGLHFDSQHAL